ITATASADEAHVLDFQQVNRLRPRGTGITKPAMGHLEGWWQFAMSACAAADGRQRPLARLGNLAQPRGMSSRVPQGSAAPTPPVVAVRGMLACARRTFAAAKAAASAASSAAQGEA